MYFKSTSSIAVIGAGIAGATCAHALRSAGHPVHVFDKSRGPGGRLATRRVEWIDRQGRSCMTRLDHGAAGFSARSAAFQAFVDQCLDAAWIAEWAPRVAAHSLPLEDTGRLYLPVPEMPALCRHLLDGVPATWEWPVDRLHRGPLGWQVEAFGKRHDAAFDAVVLALPPAQAAALLGPHRSDWARQASLAPMQACWTLMGIANAPEDSAEASAHWNLARPSSGPLACVLRSDERPGRQRVQGQDHWVVHAKAGWSRRHLEQPAEWILAQMQAALAEVLGRPVDWHHCAVHRWRYALPPVQAGTPSEPSWWDLAQGLGVCGDFLGGGGVEGAWLSAQSMAAALRRRAPAPRLTA